MNKPHSRKGIPYEVWLQRKRRRERRVFAAVIVTAIILFMLGGITGAILVSGFAPSTKNASAETITAEVVSEEAAPTEEPTKPDFRTVEIKTEGRTLDTELQTAMVDMCEKYDVPFALVLAVAEQESRFNPEAISATCDHGIMQINRVNFGWLREKGIEPLDHKGNIEAGVLMLSEAVKKYGDYHYALMAYNGGDGYAKNLWSQGTYSTMYSRSTMERFHKWESYLGGI